MRKSRSRSDGGVKHALNTARNDAHAQPRPDGGEPKSGGADLCLAELSVHDEALRPSHLVSLVPPYEQPPTPPDVRPADHLRLELDDIEEPLPGAPPAEGRP